MLVAARRGETKFHDPSRAIYLNSVSPRHCNSHKRGGGSGGGGCGPGGGRGPGGFLLGAIGNTAGDRLANGSVPGRMSGGWYGGGQPVESSVNEMDKLKPATEHQVTTTHHHVVSHSALITI